MQQYQVRFVEDSQLPTEFAFARTGSQVYLFVRESAVCPELGRCDALTRAWEVWQQAEKAPPIPIQRRVSVEFEKASR